MPQGQLSDQNRFLRVASETPDDFFVRRLEGREGISQPYRFEVELYNERGVDIASYIGTDMLFELGAEESDEPGRLFGGSVTSFGFHGLSPGDDLPIYRATIEPWLAYLTRRSDCRVFQSKSSLDICKEIFTRAGFEASTHFDLGNIARDKRDQCVQYQETDFAFVSRLLEEDGISYTFDVSKDGVKLVLIDGTFPKDLGAVSTNSTHEALPFVSSFSMRQSVHSGRFATTSFSFDDPGDDLEASSDTIITSLKRTGLESFYYAGYADTVARTKQVSERRMQEIESAAIEAAGESNQGWFEAGCTFSLTDHPVEAMNASYLLTAVEHRIDQELRARSPESADLPSYANSFRAVPTERPYRPPRVTRRPVISGTQTAIVVGAEGEEIHTDPLGRVKVRFHWDRWGAENDPDLQDWDTSCWARVAQASAGKGWGSFFIPRVGQEVVVEYLDGDPDRPLVLGTLYNGQSRFPYDTNQKNTFSGIKTLTVGGKGFNEIRFDDAADEEQIFIHAQRNYDVRILNDAFELVKGSRHRIVEKDELSHVKADRHDTTDKDAVAKVGKDHHLDVVGMQAIRVGESRSLTVSGDVAESFEGNHAEETAGDIYLKGMNVVIEAGVSLTLKVGGSSVVVDTSGVTVKGSMATIDGSLVKIASGPGSSPGSGSSGSVVAPIAATIPDEADDADPGEVQEVQRQQREKETGKYGRAEYLPLTAMSDDAADALGTEYTWIEIQLVGEDGEPIAGERYEIKSPDGRVARGSTGPDGVARVEWLVDGNCEITFPDLDEEAWEPS